MVPDTERLIYLARTGGDMPQGLQIAEVCMFQAMRSLYADFRMGRITAEQGKREKAEILNAYRRAADMQEIWDLVRRRKQTGEMAVSEYRKNPTIENADRAIDTLYGGVSRRKEIKS